MNDARPHGVRKRCGNVGEHNRVVKRTTPPEETAGAPTVPSASPALRLGFDYPTPPANTALELEISYPLAGAHDADVDHQASAIRDEALKTAGIEFQHLGNGVVGPSLSTFIVRGKGDAKDGEPLLKIQAQDWNQFKSIWAALGHGEFKEDEFEVSVIGLAAGDPRN